MKINRLMIKELILKKNFLLFFPLIKKMTNTRMFPAFYFDLYKPKNDLHLFMTLAICPIYSPLQISTLKGFLKTLEKIQTEFIFLFYSYKKLIFTKLRIILLTQYYSPTLWLQTFFICNILFQFNNPFLFFLLPTMFLIKKSI